MPDMNLRFLIISIFLFAHAISWSQEPIEQQVESLASNPEMKGAGLGILVFNTGNNSTVFEYNANNSFVPASVLKIVTSATSLELLGPDTVFTTKLAVNNEINQVNGILEGNLLIIGGGDPALGSEYFSGHYSNPGFTDVWLNEIIRLGVRGVKGDILIDESVYEGQIIPDTWIWEDMGNYYGAGANALSVFDNMFRITFSSENEPGLPTKILKVDEWARHLRFENHVLSSNQKSDKAYVYGSPWGKLRKIRGTIPKGKEQFQVKASLPLPGITLGLLLKEKLEQKNIVVLGDVKKTSENIDYDVISEIHSPPLQKIIKVLNHESVNLFAEHLIKQIAYRENGLGDTKNGAAIIKKFWEEKGIDCRGMFIEDGSGLSRFNAISPKQIVEILNYMQTTSPHSAIFKNSLPGPGQGTLYVFNNQRFPKGSLKCKSGSMTRVRCYAGYIKTNSGKELIFAFMANNFEMSHSRLINAFEEMLATLVRE